MRLYLVRHSEAYQADADPERHLTDRGRKQAKRTGSFLAHTGVSVRSILHSGKPRARETAEIIAECTGGTRVESYGQLAPNDPVERIAEELNRAEEDLMIVGHLPHLAKLASRLLTGREDEAIIDFAEAGCICLERTEGGRWRLLWSMNPEIL